MPRVTLRPLSEKDCDARWVRWLNDPAVSQWLASRGKIRWTLPRLHRWFRAHARRPGTRIYGIMVGRRRVGTLKIKGLGSERWASVGLMIGERRWRGRGVGAAAIHEAVTVAERVGNLGVWAGMRSDNYASFWAFSKAAFGLACDDQCSGDEFAHPADVFEGRKAGERRVFLRLKVVVPLARKVLR